MQCPACAADVAEGQRFCGQCGSAVQLACPACGSANPPGHKFCGECGHALGASASPSAAPRQPDGPGVEPRRVSTERRVCSILFCDLVGFTTISESRDPEDVRELLSAYFDAARTVITRYGGVVEKFIGDAVMAVWGTPVAAEGDAERAVRAALDLVAAVAHLGERTSLTGLGARAGVVTGEVAVNLDAVGEGMLAGDAVNTAARIQAIAPAGTVLVDEATERLTRSAVVFDAAGTHELKGKSEPVPVWRAERVISTVGGEERMDGLEAALVGRAAELRLIKEIFHDSVDRAVPRLLSLTGSAGVGKSRLGWEFEKYIDGLAQVIWWHRGRCLAYGDGVAFWALAEMVRQRFGIAEEDPSDVVAETFSRRLVDLVPDPALRDFVAPRLGRLLGVGNADGVPMDPNELFAGWRVFFEQLAAQGPVVMVVEDLHRADDGLLDFLAHLLDWSRDSPIFVLTLGRSEILDRRPGWGTGRGATAVALEPLSDSAMTDLLDALVPDLPAAAAAAIARQAEGIPLYAIETVRMLVDRDVIRPVGGAYRLTGEIGELQVPDTLQSLLAARLDSLPGPLRSLVADAAVLGATFPLDALVSLRDAPAAGVREMLDELVRRGVFAVRADPLSPERGQYGFTQAMLRQVAYDTLSRRERKTLHLKVAQHLLDAFGAGDDMREVVAEHYLDALASVPDDEDATELRGKAVASLERAADRAVRTGALTSAVRTLLRAAEVSESIGTEDADVAAADARAQAAELMQRIRLRDDGVAQFELAEQLYRRHGRTRRATTMRFNQLARTTASRSAEDFAEMESLAAELSNEPDADTVEVLFRLGGVWALSGGDPEAAERNTRAAVVLAQTLGIGGNALSRALERHGLGLYLSNRTVEAEAMYREALRIAESTEGSNELGDIMMALGDLLITRDPAEAVRLSTQAIDQARRLGARGILGVAATNLQAALYLLGRWDEVEEVVAAAERDDYSDAWLPLRPLLAAHARGDVARVLELRDQMVPLLADSGEVQDRIASQFATAVGAAVQGQTAAAAELYRAMLTESAAALGIGWELTVMTWAAAADNAAADLAEMQWLIDWLDTHPRGHIPPVLQAERAFAVARQAALTGVVDSAADQQAVETARAIGLEYVLCRALLNQAEHVAASDPGRAAAAALEADGIAARLRIPTLRERAASLIGTNVETDGRYAVRLNAPAS